MLASVNGERRAVTSRDTVPPEVKFEGRTFTDIWFGVFYVLSYITYLALGFYIVANSHSPYERDENDERVFDTFLEAPEIIVGLTAFVLGIVILYALLLRYFSKPMVFLSEIAKVALLITAGVYMGRHSTETGIVCYFLAALNCVYIVWARDKI